MKDKGQITLFVIIAILFVSIIGIAVYFINSNTSTNTEETESSETMLVKTEVENCMQTTLEKGLYLIGFQGGYINPLSQSIKTNLSTISYAYYQGNVLFPSLADINNQLENYLDSELPNCIDFSNFADFSVSVKKSSSEVNIKENEISVNIMWPITITAKESSYKLEKFDKNFQYKFYNVYDSAKTIVDNTALNPKTIDMDYLLSLNQKYNITPDIVPYGASFVYSLTYPDLEVIGNQFIFFIAVKP